MITGTIMLDIDIDVRSAAAATALSKQICDFAKGLQGVKGANEVDNDLSGGDEDEGPADPAE
jgi:hypothetical protein